MPKKLQVKLLSNSGELLNVVNCFAGQLAVLRANSPSDLRPYQRALAGSQGKEKFSITVDGVEYRPELHTLIGMGEPAPHAGLTTKEYLGSLGVPDGSIHALLSSYGLEGTQDKKCSSLSADEERRVRLLAAACTPSKVLVVNEPFEPILSQWKERFAELLTSYVRSKNAIVIVTSLSNRPECWIDNEVVARVQVGDAIQKTIGFGAASSQSTVLMNQLRDLLRDESKVQELLQKQGVSTPPNQSGTALAAGAAIIATDSELDDDLDYDNADGAAASSVSLSDRFRFLTPSSPLGALSMACAGVVALGVAAVGVRFFTATNKASPASVDVASVSAPANSAPTDVASEKSPPAPLEQQPLPPVDPPAGRVSERSVERPPPPAPRFVLDEYPELIRVSVLDTTRGIAGEMPAGTDSSADHVNVDAPKAPSSGNLFKLLESASTNQPDKPSDSYPGGPSSPPDAGGQSSWSEPQSAPEGDASDEQTRREAIRQKFLEAIRAAAERRQAAMETGQ